MGQKICVHRLILTLQGLDHLHGDSAALSAVLLPPEVGHIGSFKMRPSAQDSCLVLSGLSLVVLVNTLQ